MQKKKKPTTTTEKVKFFWDCIFLILIKDFYEPLQKITSKGICEGVNFNKSLSTKDIYRNFKLTKVKYFDLTAVYPECSLLATLLEKH